MDQTPVISAKGLTKEFAPETGVFDMDLDVAKGTIVGLIGPSGSGKTTTVRMMAGLLAPDSGTVEVFGETPTNFRSDTRANLGYMPQSAVLYPDLTLAQNLRFAASLFGLNTRLRRRRIKELVEFVELDGAMKRLPREASGGEKRRVALAAALVHSPDLIFLDEPTAGLDPVLRKKFWERFEDLAEAGRTLVVTTQYVGEAAYCDLVGVLADGRLLILDTPDGLRKAAFGGELVDIVFAERPTREEVAAFGALPGGGEYEWIDDRSIRINVEDAGTAIPMVGTWATENGVTIEKTEPHVPPFDDIFVELVQKLGNSPTEAEAGEVANVG